jgi:DNA-binding response OmpR family regulator
VNVLIVEDDVPIAELLREALELNGHHVCEIARTLDEAMEEAERHRPDYAIVDVHLADGSLGTDLARRLRDIHTVRVLFSTGNSDDWSFAAHEGDAVMTKPYSMRDVIRGLKIVDQIALHGRSDLKFPPNFRIIGKDNRLISYFMDATSSRHRDQLREVKS